MLFHIILSLLMNLNIFAHNNNSLSLLFYCLIRKW